MADIPSVRVVGRLGLTVGDGSDPDEFPDVTWCDEGIVRFTPLNTYVKVAGGSPTPFMAGNTVIDVPIDGDGFLTWQGGKYVWLFDLTSDQFNPTIGSGKATHKVEFRNVKSQGTAVDFPVATVRLAADTVAGITAAEAAAYGLSADATVCDLTALTPVPAAGGTPITRGVAGVGVAALAVADGSLAYTLTDGTEGDAGELPVGPGGSDEGVAAYVADPDSETTAALASSIAARAIPLEAAVEMQPMVAIGHSYIGQNNQTVNTRAHERAANRLRMGAITNFGQPGKYIRLVAMSAYAGTFAWVLRTRALIWLMCTINDVQLHGDDPAGIREYGWSWRALLSRVTANAAIPVSRRDWVFTSGWSAETISAVVDNVATGGRRYNASAVGEYFEFAYTDTGTGVDVVGVSKSTAGGVLTLTEGSTTLGTLDFTQPALGDSLHIFRIRGLAAGAHTIRGTITTEGRVDVDSINIPAITPSAGVVLGEGLVNRVPDVGTTSYEVLLSARKSELASIVADYPTFSFMDVDADPTPDGVVWDKTLMLREDNTHPNDWGAAFIASRAIEALRGGLFIGGLNVLAAPEPFYVNPTSPAIPDGGFPGSGIPLAGEYYDTLGRDDAAVPGNLDTGQSWTVYGTATWGPLNGVMVTKSGGVSMLGVTTSSADCTVRAIMGPRLLSDAYGCIAFRGVDANNFWSIRFRLVNGLYCYNISSRTSGSLTEVAYTSTQAQPGDLVEVVLSASSIQLRVNGAVQTLNLIAGGTATSYTSTTRQTAVIHGWEANFASNGTRAGFSSWSCDV